jgi:hypothetical protein
MGSHPDRPASGSSSSTGYPETQSWIAEADFISAALASVRLLGWQAVAAQAHSTSGLTRHVVTMWSVRRPLTQEPQLGAVEQGSDAQTDHPEQHQQCDQSGAHADPLRGGTPARLGLRRRRSSWGAGDGPDPLDQRCRGRHGFRVDHPSWSCSTHEFSWVPTNSMTNEKGLCAGRAHSGGRNLEFPSWARVSPAALNRPVCRENPLRRPNLESTASTPQRGNRSAVEDVSTLAGSVDPLLEGLSA